SYFEWIGAGIYRLDERSGSMHGKKLLAREVHYGVDERNFYLRVDLNSDSQPQIETMEAKLTFRAGPKRKLSTVAVVFGHGTARTEAPASCAFGRILELRIPL